MAIDAAVPCMGMVYTSPYEPEAEVQYLRGVDGKLDFQWQTMIDPNHATTKPFQCLQDGQGANNQYNTQSANKTRASDLDNLEYRDPAPPANETNATTIIAPTDAVTVRFKMQVRIMTPNHTENDGQGSGSGYDDDYKVSPPSRVVLKGGNSSTGTFVDGWDRLPPSPGPFVDPNSAGAAANFSSNIVWPLQQVGPGVSSTATSACCLHTNLVVDALEDYWVVPSADHGLQHFGRSVAITTAAGCLAQSTVGCAPLVVVGGWHVGSVFQLDGGQLVPDLPAGTKLTFAVNVSRRVEDMALVREDTMERLNRGNLSSWVSAAASQEGLAVFVSDQCVLQRCFRGCCVTHMCDMVCVFVVVVVVVVVAFSPRYAFPYLIGVRDGVQQCGSISLPFVPYDDVPTQGVYGAPPLVAQGGNVAVSGDIFAIGGVVYEQTLNALVGEVQLYMHENITQRCVWEPHGLRLQSDRTTHTYGAAVRLCCPLRCWIVTTCAPAVFASYRRFGAALAISDGFLVVGEPAVDPYTPTAAAGGMVPPAPYEGVVRLFYVNGSSAIIVRPPDDVAEPSFGAAVAMADHVGVMGVS